MAGRNALRGRALSGVAFVVAAVAVPVAAQPVSRDGLTRLEAKTRAGAITVSIATLALDGVPDGGAVQLLRGDCPDERGPCSVVANVAITVGGAMVPVPRSAWAGVANLQSASLTAGPRHKLMLRGGDAKAPFALELQFTDDRMVHRRFWSGSTAGPASEETDYRQTASSSSKRR